MTGEAELAGATGGLVLPEPALADAARAALDAKTKPPGSLGRLEDLAVRIACARGTVEPPPLAPVVVVAAGDHGIAREGVSACPPATTEQRTASAERPRAT